MTGGGATNGARPVGRPETPLDAAAGPVQALSHALRELRRAAGNPSYTAMARRSGRSASSLSDAARGRRLPTWPTVRSYVLACGGDPDSWLARWESAAGGRAPAAPNGDQEFARRSTTAGHALVEAVTSTQSRATSRDSVPRRMVRPGFGGIAVLTGLTVAVVVGSAGSSLPSRQTGAGPTARPPTAVWILRSEVPPSPGGSFDAVDPIRAGCGSPDVSGQIITMDQVPLKLPSGMDFGALRLRHQPRCRASWGYVSGPHGAQRRVYITARRPADRVAAPSDFAGDSPDSYGNMLSTDSGCVYVEAYVETPEGNGPLARTQCA